MEEDCSQIQSAIKSANDPDQMPVFTVDVLEDCTVLHRFLMVAHSLLESQLPQKSSSSTLLGEEEEEISKLFCYLSRDYQFGNRG